MGMSRSATSVIMFIMRLFSMKLEDAFEFVKTQRQATDPNDGFMEQLRNFEKTSFSFQDELEQSEASSNLAASDNDSPENPVKLLKRMSSCQSQAPIQTRLNHAVHGKKGKIAGKLRLGGMCSGMGSTNSLLDLIPENPFSNRKKEPQTPKAQLFNENDEFGQLKSKSDDIMIGKKFP